jgi:catechol 2,3-dioxygenase-like lactoylglutathione lyase family enzyme
MNWTLEVVVVPVSNVDRAKAFYAERIGFNLDHDTRDGDESGVVQLTPPGSGCSIVVVKPGVGAGSAIAGMTPGSLKGLQLVVSDIRAARDQLVERGVDLSEIQVADASGGFRASREGDSLDNVGFLFFSDPDGNGWAVQQISARG